MLLDELCDSTYCGCGCDLAGLEYGQDVAADVDVWRRVR
jgi:hypothetical protein